METAANGFHSCIPQRSMRRIGIRCGVLRSRMILMVCFIPISFPTTVGRRREGGKKRREDSKKNEC